MVATSCQSGAECRLMSRSMPTLAALGVNKNFLHNSREWGQYFGELSGNIRSNYYDVRAPGVVK